MTAVWMTGSGAIDDSYPWRPMTKQRTIDGHVTLERGSHVADDHREPAALRGAEGRRSDEGSDAERSDVVVRNSGVQNGRLNVGSEITVGIRIDIILVVIRVYNAVTCVQPRLVDEVRVIGWPGDATVVQGTSSAAHLATTHRVKSGLVVETMGRKTISLTSYIVYIHRVCECVCVCVCV